VDTIQFRFELRDLAEVVPWGSAETGLTLHWFGLTDGWYDVIIGEHRLFGGPEDPRGIDYQVVRLWEDLIEVAPSALAEIPAVLHARLANVDAWKSWVEKARELDDRDELVTVASSWWFERQLSAIHLVGAPALQLWRMGDELRIHWHSSPRAANGSTWSSPNGNAVVMADAFRQALIDFDRDLISAMENRVTEIERGWRRSEITIDVEHLRREQVDRSTWLERALLSPRARAWDEVVDAVLELERRVGSSSLE